MTEKVNAVNPLGSAGVLINPAPAAVEIPAEKLESLADVPTAEATLAALENTLNDLDPVVDTRTDEEKAADEAAQKTDEADLDKAAAAAPAPGIDPAATSAPPVGEIADAAVDSVIAGVTGEPVATEDASVAATEAEHAAIEPVDGVQP